MKNPKAPLAEVYRRIMADPALWCETVLGVRLWEKQREVLRALAGTCSTVAVKSCNGAGKTFLSACAVLWWAYTRPDSYVITTAPSARQVTRLLWRELRGIHGRTPMPLGGTVLPQAPELRVAPGWGAVGFAPKDGTSALGFHARGGVLAVLDEAVGVNEDVWAAVRSSTVGERDRVLAISNPISTQGAFAQLFAKPSPDVSLHTISALDTPNVVEGRDVFPGMISRKWVEDRKAEWGEASGLYRSRVLGEFPEGDGDGLVPLAWLEAAHQRWDALQEEGWPAVDVIALDVASLGDDHSVVAVSTPAGVKRLEKRAGLTIPQVAEWAVDLARREGAREIRVDADGIGVGAWDIVARAWPRTAELHNGAPAMDPRYGNNRAHWHWHLREMLDPSNPRAIALPRDDRLDLQLASIRLRDDPARGRIVIEHKRDLRDRIKHSPDEADACVYAFAPLAYAAAPPVFDASVGTAQRIGGYL